MTPNKPEQSWSVPSVPEQTDDVPDADLPVLSDADLFVLSESGSASHIEPDIDILAPPTRGTTEGWRRWSIREPDSSARAADLRPLSSHESLDAATLEWYEVSQMSKKHSLDRIEADRRAIESSLADGSDTEQSEFLETAATIGRSMLSIALGIPDLSLLDLPTGPLTSILYAAALSEVARRPI